MKISGTRLVGGDPMTRAMIYQRFIGIYIIDPPTPTYGNPHVGLN